MKDMVSLSGVWYKHVGHIGFDDCIHLDEYPANNYCSIDKNMYASYTAEELAGVFVNMTEPRTKPEEKDQSKKL